MGGGVCRDTMALLPPEYGASNISTLASLHGSFIFREGFNPATVIVANLVDWESAGVGIVRTSDEP